MAKQRPEVPPPVAEPLMVANRHTCCICHEARKHVAIHHIDGNPANNDPKNLAVVCHDCHSRVTGDEGLGRRYTAGEVSRYKQKWEETCAKESPDASDDEEDDDEPAATDYEVISLEPDTNQPYGGYDLEAGDLVTASISSNRPIDALLLTKRAYRRFMNNEDFNWIGGGENVYETEIAEPVEKDGTYMVLLINRGNSPAKVRVDIAIWPAPEDDEDEEDE